MTSSLNSSDMNLNIIITPKDLMSAGMCNMGARKFCTRFGLDWLTFIRHGLKVESLVLAVGSPNDEDIRRLYNAACTRLGLPTVPISQLN